MNSIGWRVFFCVSYLLSIELTVLAGPTFAQIYHVQEMNTERSRHSIAKRQLCFSPWASSKSTARTCRSSRTVT